MVGAGPPVAQVVGVGGEQDGSFEFAGVHVVVIAAGDTGSGTGFGPVLATRIQPQFELVGGLVGMLDDIGEYGVAAVGVDDDQPSYLLVGEGLGDVGDDGGEGGGADADGAGIGGVFMRAAEGNWGQLKDPVMLGDCCGDGTGDESVSAQRQVGPCCSKAPTGSTAILLVAAGSVVVRSGMMSRVTL
ncbi:hypothetical protein BZL29_6549 [Mycobacterium kansasii]|uniref:Uncharacterized protein n=1 Tax=Mycobacterium kansasii TaxID=1768 RepID=A0A1V3WQ29_MYCKA|nr:hypothetical protein BZL29_6549 [Mycobacterium kansasii]